MNSKMAKQSKEISNRKSRYLQEQQRKRKRVLGAVVALIAVVIIATPALILHLTSQPEVTPQV